MQRAVAFVYVLPALQRRAATKAKRHIDFVKVDVGKKTTRKKKTPFTT